MSVGVIGPCCFASSAKRRRAMPRARIRTHGGRSAVDAAVDAAVKAQLALELPERMGIATGEAELRDGDYFGTVLNRAARVMATGHGGQRQCCSPC
jgi:class 3 adenylate cyclase